jgi:hypothetical protein
MLMPFASSLPEPRDDVRRDMHGGGDHVNQILVDPADVLADVEPRDSARPLSPEKTPAVKAAPAGIGDRPATTTRTSIELPGGEPGNQVLALSGIEHDQWPGLPVGVRVFEKVAKCPEHHFTDRMLNFSIHFFHHSFPS